MWVRFWVRGKSEAQVFRWFEGSDASEENLKFEAEEWASNTSQGILNDMYRYGFERNVKLPKEERLRLLSHFRAEKAHAEAMIKRLIPKSERT